MSAAEASDFAMGALEALQRASPRSLAVTLRHCAAVAAAVRAGDRGPSHTAHAGFWLSGAHQRCCVQRSDPESAQTLPTDLSPIRWQLPRCPRLYALAVRR